MVLGPQLLQLQALYRQALVHDKQFRQSLAPVDDRPEEHFSAITVLENPDLLPGPPPNSESGDCKPSDNARKRAKVEATDRSVANLASTVLLLRYRGKTFLHTGDSRADLILNGLVSSGLMEQEGRAHVNLLLLPHLGSNRNLRPEFLQRVTADRYLFSGNGIRFRRPEIAVIAALIRHARARSTRCISSIATVISIGMSRRTAGPTPSALCRMTGALMLSLPRRNSIIPDIDASFGLLTMALSSSIFSTGSPTEAGEKRFF